MRLFSIIILLFLSYNLVFTYEYKYHNYEDITKMLKSYAEQFPAITNLYSIGRSLEGRELWVLALAKQNASQHVPLRPEAKYVGAMHGNVGL